jgi:hypothetical protein
MERLRAQRYGDDTAQERCMKRKASNITPTEVDLSVKQHT